MSNLTQTNRPTWRQRQQTRWEEYMGKRMLRRCRKQWHLLSIIANVAPEQLSKTYPGTQRITFRPIHLLELDKHNPYRVEIVEYQFSYELEDKLWKLKATHGPENERHSHEYDDTHLQFWLDLSLMTPEELMSALENGNR